MNIGFDGKRAANNLTGLGNYSRSLIAQLAGRFPQNQYFVYTPKQRNSSQINSFLKIENVHLKLPEKNSFSILWRSLGIKRQLRKDNIDLFHGLSHEIPFGIPFTKIKTVVSIHDLIFLHYPDYYKPIDRFIYNLKARYASKNSDRIVAISHQTKKDLVDFYQVEEKKIEVIYQSCDDAFKRLCTPQSLELVKSKYALPDQYLLNVGTIEPRKNLLLIINALKNIHPAYKLIVVGKSRPYTKLVKEQISVLGLTDRVIFLKDLPFADLPAIYQMATVFIYPSFYEGFGIPIIEALYSNVPVIAATGSCLEEAGGPGSIYIDPNDSIALSNAVNDVLNDPALRQKMASAGLNYVQKFNNELLSAQMMECYLKTMNGN